MVFWNFEKPEKIIFLFFWFWSCSVIHHSPILVLVVFRLWPDGPAMPYWRCLIVDALHNLYLSIRHYGYLWQKSEPGWSGSLITRPGKLINGLTSGSLPRSPGWGYRIREKSILKAGRTALIKANEGVCNALTIVYFSRSLKKVSFQDTGSSESISSYRLDPVGGERASSSGAVLCSVHG